MGQPVHINHCVLDILHGGTCPSIRTKVTHGAYYRSDIFLTTNPNYSVGGGGGRNSLGIAKSQMETRMLWALTSPCSFCVEAFPEVYHGPAQGLVVDPNLSPVVGYLAAKPAFQLPGAK